MSPSLADRTTARDHERHPMTQQLQQREASVTSLDAWLSSEDVFLQPYAEGRSELVRHLRESLVRHQESNPAFAAFLDRLGLEPGKLTEETLDDLPYVPSALFKNSPELVRTESADGLYTTSSGTKGSISRVYRDNVTIERFFGTITASVRELLAIQDSETRTYNLGPVVEESQHLWISYVMAGVSLVHDSDFYVTGGTLEIDRLVADLREHDGVPPVT
jgi:long-chain-fatty-acid---luciferin-component ligase